MSEFTIEAGVSIPKKRTRGADVKYPFAQLKVGQSFYVPPDAGDTLEVLMARMRNAGFRASKMYPGTKYTLRAWELGVRCWRVK